MKRIYFCTICFLVVLFMCSCEIGSTTELLVINESSYDLHIKFITKKLLDSQNGYKEIDIKKDESVVLILLDTYGGARPPRDLNNEVEKIVFYNLDNNEIIKEIDNNQLFDNTYYQGSKNFKAARADYQFKITDELLF